LNTENLNTFVRSHVGNLCYVSRMPEDLDDHIVIGVWSDEVVVDSVTNSPRLHIIPQPDLFRGFFEKTERGLVAVFPGRDQIADQINASRSKVTENSESSLLTSIGAKILKIPSILNQINPIMMILDGVLNTSSISVTDFNNADRIPIYVNFLRSLDIIDVENNHIVPGRFTSSEMDVEMDRDELYNALLDRIVRMGYARMFTDLHITHLQPFMRMTNVNCMTSLIEEKPLKWDWSIYRRYLKSIYNENQKKGNIVSNAMQLKRATIMKAEKNSSNGDTMYYCASKIFDEYSEKFRLRPTYA